jgi:hypothetical protein
MGRASEALGNDDIGAVVRKDDLFSRACDLWVRLERPDLDAIGYSKESRNNSKSGSTFEHAIVGLDRFNHPNLQHCPIGIID